jgi:hypothetical protein
MQFLKKTKSLIAEMTPHSHRTMLKCLMIHLDNAHPHNSRWFHERIAASKAQCLPHPAYNPDRAPSDFFLFGHLNEKLLDFKCENRDDLKTDF